jgi:hypothetical protein
MRQNRQIPSMEEIENPVIYSSLSHPRLMNAISEKISKRSPKFMPKFRQALNGGDALRVRLLIRPAQFLEPIENWNISSVSW